MVKNTKLRLIGLPRVKNGKLKVDLKSDARHFQRAQQNVEQLELLKKNQICLIEIFYYLTIFYQRYVSNEIFLIVLFVGFGLAHRRGQRFRGCSGCTTCVDKSECSKEAEASQQ